MASRPHARDIQGWLDTLRLEAHAGCVRTVPDPSSPVDVAAYARACRLLAAEANPRPTLAGWASARLLSWLFPGAEAEAEP